jgi:hypothetical protein
MSAAKHVHILLQLNSSIQECRDLFLIEDIQPGLVVPVRSINIETRQVTLQITCNNRAGVSLYGAYLIKVNYRKYTHSSFHSKRLNYQFTIWNQGP